MYTTIDEWCNPNLKNNKMMYREEQRLNMKNNDQQRKTNKALLWLKKKYLLRLEIRATLQQKFFEYLKK